MSLGVRAVGIEPDADGGVEVATSGSPGRQSRTYRAVANCAWQQQVALVQRARPRRLSFRVKAAARLPGLPGDRTSTLVLGPFGDVVRHRDYTYVSWYPVGLLHHDEGVEPTPEAIATVRTIGARHDLVGPMVDALVQRRLIEPRPGEGEPLGGFIVGHAGADIGQPESPLHNRSEFGVEWVGNVAMPLNFKFSTAPLAASRVAEAVATRVRSRVASEGATAS